MQLELGNCEAEQYAGNSENRAGMRIAQYLYHFIGVYITLSSIVFIFFYVGRCSDTKKTAQLKLHTSQL